ncbi:Acyl-CoA thioester hydrolase OS=Ureibacillus acetophenoni OX=614649 GN=SAMN05877842_11930 PE=4 SV=1 [Ureibacillus acetophenoni]
MEHITTYTVTENEIDELGHMNYLHYIMQFTNSRMEWLKEVGLSFHELVERKLGPVLLKVETEYSKEVRLGDTVEIRTRLTKVGTKSFTVEQTMLHDGQISASSTSILVIMDLQARKAIPVPDEIARNKWDNGDR